MQQEPIINLPTFSRINCPSSGGRSSHSSILYKNYLITLGGWNNKGLTDIVVLNLETGQWTAIVPEGPPMAARYGHTMCLVDEDQIIVYGGRGDSKVIKELGILTVEEIKQKKSRIVPINPQPLAISWEVIKTTAKTPYRARHSAHLYQDKMYIIGGIDKDKRSVNDMWCMDLDFKWKEVATTGTQKERSSHGHVQIGDKIYVFGGIVTTNTVRLNDMQMLNFSTMAWQNIKLKGVIPCPMYGSSMVEDNGKLLLFGGYKENGECSSDLFSYDIKTFKWERAETAGHIPEGRCYQTLTRYKNDLIIWGGWKKDTLYSDIFILTLNNKVEAEIEVEDENDGAAPAGVPVSGKQLLRSNRKNFALKNLFLDPVLSDVTFKVEDQEFPAHRNILMMSCAHFEAMFNNDTLQAQPEITIEIANTKAAAFKAVLEFLYLDEVELNESFARELLHLSHDYGLEELRIGCEKFLTWSISPDNFVELAKVVDHLKMDTLKNSIVTFIKENFSLIEKRDDLYELPQSILIEAMSKLGS